MNPNPNLLSMKLICSCPPDCICKSDEPREWNHTQCSKPQYITSQGDVFCNQKGCSSQFIKDLNFSCKEAKKHSQSYQYKSAIQFIMSYAQAISILSSLGGNDLISFVSSLNSEIMKRWNV